MKEKTRNKFSKSFHILYFISFISIAVPFSIQLVAKELQMVGLLVFSVYANIYVIIPLLLISLIVSIIFDFGLYGIKQGLKETSLRLLMIIIAVFIFIIGFKAAKYKENQLEVTFKNESTIPIKHIKLHGRNALTEVDNLLPGADTVMVFRGKDIIYNTGNSFENEVTLLYYMDSIWLRHPVLKGFSKSRVWNGPFQLTIHNPDSVEFKYTD